MRIITIIHDDFEFVVDCNNIENVFNIAKKKQLDIFSSTYYKVSEGIIKIYNFNNTQLDSNFLEKTHPLFFENKDYSVGIKFHNKESITTPFLQSKIKEIEEKFFYREDLGFLSGNLNYGNELGKTNLIIVYVKNGVTKTIDFNFEVFPTKLDYKNDYEKIITDIEKEYSYLVLDFLKKTYSSFKTGDSPNTDLIWWQVFGGIYKELIKSSRFILNRPHSTIINEVRYQRAEKIQKWNNLLEEEYKRHEKFPNKLYRLDLKTLNSNTTENQFFKFAVFQTLKRFIKVKVHIKSLYSKSLSNSFINELNIMEKELHIISSNPFFRSIESFRGLKQESLVLQKATGYSSVYKSWIMLNSGLKFLDGIQQIELKNIAELYQIWCFLEMKNVLQSLLGKSNPDEVELAEIHVDDFVFKIERGIKSKISFKNSNGDLIDLYHDYSFDTESGLIKSYTVKQRPDIVLQITKNDLKENYILSYLFDAKYRLQSDEKENAPELPPDDAINQMHRYRDAIYFKSKNKPEKEIIGAYILFPGSGNLESVKKLDYFKSINTVNIGAFPLRPNDEINKILLKNHLRNLLQLDTESILNEVSTQKDSIYESFNPFVLIGFVPDLKHYACIEREKDPFYFTGIAKPKRFGYGDLKYFAPYLKGNGIKEYFEILDYSLVNRNELFKTDDELYKNEVGERLKIKLGKKYVLQNNKFLKISDGNIGHTPYRYTKLTNLKNINGDKIKII
jgi:hypothetical protein